MDNFTFILLIPVWISTIIISAKFIGLYIPKRYVVSLSLLSVIINGLYSIWGYIYIHYNSFYEDTINFLTIDNINFQLGIYVDVLSSIMGIVISTITFIIYLYSIFYMANEKSFSRYYSLLNLFYFAILLFIYSPNLFQSLISWELIGVISYLLIGYWYTKNSVSVDSKRVLLINIIGDICLFSVFIIISYLVTSISSNINFASVAFSDINFIFSAIIGATTPEIYTFICILILIAAFIKSAQFPFNSWLINAMSAPTPVSALIHSSTLIIAGIYLILRLLPVILSNTIIVKTLVLIGLITAITASLSALVQTNIKKSLAYSTSAQLGIVFICLGCYNPIAAIVYLISHAFIKALLFTSSGFAIKLVNNKNIMFMGGLREHITTAAICFLIGGIALSGLGFCGFNSKYIVSELFCTSLLSKTLFYIIGILTTIYIFRLYFLVFENKSNNNYSSYTVIKNYKFGIISILCFSLTIILLSFITPTGHICPLYIINLILVGISYYLFNPHREIKRIKIIHNLLLNGFYLSNLYYWGETIIYKYYTLLLVFIDKHIIGGLEYITKKILLIISKYIHNAQNNSVQTYISSGIWNLIFTIGFFVITYLVILNVFGV